MEQSASPQQSPAGDLKPICVELLKAIAAIRGQATGSDTAELDAVVSRLKAKVEPVVPDEDKEVRSEHARMLARLGKVEDKKAKAEANIARVRSELVGFCKQLAELDTELAEVKEQVVALNARRLQLPEVGAAKDGQTGAPAVGASPSDTVPVAPTRYQDAACAADALVAGKVKVIEASLAKRQKPEEESHEAREAAREKVAEAAEKLKEQQRLYEEAMATAKKIGLQIVEEAERVAATTAGGSSG